jgi:predicted amidohydrolase
MTGIGQPRRIAMAQMLVEPGEPGRNLARALAMIADAAARGAQAIVLPETCDAGWTAAAAANQAEPVPGARSAALCAAARAHGIVVAAGLTERSGAAVHNSAVLIDADGTMVATHRKIAELDFARAIYVPGEHLRVAQTAIGCVGLAICADYWRPELGVAQVAMGADVLLSPSAWAVPPGFDNQATPYGAQWIESYRAMIAAGASAVIGVSNVGPVVDGAWAGHACIGASIAMGRGGRIAARGPFGVDAEALVMVDL